MWLQFVTSKNQDFKRVIYIVVFLKFNELRCTLYVIVRFGDIGEFLFLPLLAKTSF